MRRLAVPQRWSRVIALVEALEPGDLEPGVYFTSEELDLAPHFSLAQRRDEWLAARLAAKLLAVELGICRTAAECRIERSGRAPEIVLAEGIAPVSLSISHSHGKGAAAIMQQSAGIDLEGMRPIEPRVERFFLHPEEIAMREGLTVPDASLHLWSAKEAALKASGCETFKDLALSLEAERDNGVELTFQWSQVSGFVETERIEEDFVLALAAKE
ncbi:MAG: 4'-phosphopantetheinyl transferase family protein [Thermoanaerobaculia bacterium]